MLKRLKHLVVGIATAIALLASTLAGAGACCSTFSILPDTTRSFSSSVLIPPTYTDAIVLVANVSQTQAVPSAAMWVVFSSNCNFYALTGASAAVPGATTTNGSAAMLNPSAWSLANAPTQITVVAPTACVVTMSFYQ
jgi:hypothetical protein